MFEAVIIIIVIIMILLAIRSTWHNLNDLDNVKKIIFIIIGILANISIALIVFNLSKENIDYDVGVVTKIKNILICVITPLNMLVTLPFIASTIDKIRYQEIDDKEMQKRIIIYVVFILIFLICEINYLEKIQLGAMQIFENLSK